MTHAQMETHMCQSCFYVHTNDKYCPWCGTIYDSYSDADDAQMEHILSEAFKAVFKQLDQSDKLD